MSPIREVIVIVAVMAGIALSQTDGTAPKPAATKVAPSVDGRSDAMRALRVRIPKVEFANTSLEDALQQLADQLHVNLTVRWGRLEAAGVRRDEEINLSLKQITFRDALLAVLDQTSPAEELAYRVSPEKILVSTLSDINSEMIVRVYQVGDLTHQSVDPSLFVGQEFTYIQSIQPVVDENSAAPMPIIGRLPIGVSFGGTGSDAPDLDLNTGQFEERNNDEDADEPEPGAPGTIEDLIRVIVNTVEPQSWRDNGGQGTITAFKGQLVVRNSLYVHQILGGSFEHR